MEPMPPSEQQRAPRWVLIRDVGVLQVKLIIDGFRDLLLVPASLVAGIISLVRTENGQPGPEFYRLVGAGKRSEHWINLFGALKNAPAGVIEPEELAEADMDELINRVEIFVIDEYQRGGVTAQAKARLDKALAAMQRHRRRKSREPAPTRED
jgi:hypothetical protein